MATATIAAVNLRKIRAELAISQSKLARLSGVSRFKICTYELGHGSLTEEEQNRIRRAILAETDRIRNISVEVEFSQPEFGSADELCR